MYPFDHAAPLRQWRTQWPPTYEALLSRLRQQADTESQAIRAFIQILQLHQDRECGLVEAAIEQALKEGLATPTGVRFCLNRLTDPTPVVAPLDLSQLPQLAQVGHQPISLAHYDQFLQEVVQ